jgi:hypothetical protein
MIRTLVVAAFVVATTAIGVAPAAVADGPYANCSEARANIPQGDPDYWSAGDRDSDGIACES